MISRRRAWHLAASTLALTLVLAVGMYVMPILAMIWLDGPLSVVLMSGEDTVYSSNYSHIRFVRLRRGMALEDVTAALGQPLYEVWEYLPSDGSRAAGLLKLDPVTRVVRGDDTPRAGWNATQVVNDIGRPARVYLGYSRPGSDSHYRIREVVFRHDIVEYVRSSFCVD